MLITVQIAEITLSIIIILKIINKIINKIIKTINKIINSENVNSSDIAPSEYFAKYRKNSEY